MHLAIREADIARVTQIPAGDDDQAHAHASFPARNRLLFSAGTFVMAIAGMPPSVEMFTLLKVTFSTGTFVVEKKPSNRRAVRVAVQSGMVGSNVVVTDIADAPHRQGWDCHLCDSTILGKSGSKAIRHIDIVVGDSIINNRAILRDDADARLTGSVDTDVLPRNVRKISPPFPTRFAARYFPWK